jgi:RNA polymerase sigma-70 factor (ECF subfamily)
MPPHPESPNTSGPSAHQLFTILAREHADMLITYLRSVVRDANVAEDLFQETMLVAWRKLAESDQSLPFGPWLRGIAGRLILEHRRKAAANSTLPCTPELLDALEAEFAAFEQRPGDTFRSRAERLRTCLERLPALLRDAVHLVYVRGLSLHSMATALGATNEAVKKRVQRARQLLAECLESSGSAA